MHYTPITTTSPLVSLTFINSSLAFALRKAVKDLYVECLMSTGVLVAETSLKGRYGKTYFSQKTEGEIGKDDGGSVDSVVEIDWSKADRSRSETSTFPGVRNGFPIPNRHTLLG